MNAVCRVILHLDMDAFFASIEQRDHPEWRGKPVIVGAPPKQRGVVCAASYEARPFGVRSAMPSATAYRLCPHGIFVKPRGGVYGAESRKIMALVEKTGTLVEQVSIDEAYIDVSPLVVGKSEDIPPDEALARAIPMAKALKERIREATRLTASIGIASNKLLAKIASDLRKPDGLHVIFESRKEALLRPLPIEMLRGVGRATAQRMRDHGIRTFGDLQDYQDDLQPLAGSWGETLREFAFGRDDRPLETEWETQSIGSEHTFLRDTEDRRILRGVLHDQAQELEEGLHDHGFGARTVRVKVRYGDFSTLTRQISIQDAVATEGDIYRLACFLLARDRLVSRPLRLLGLSVSGLCAPDLQLRLPFKEGLGAT